MSHGTRLRHTESFDLLDAWQFLRYDTARTGWKFAQWAIAAPKDYNKIYVGVFYAFNTGTAMFSNVFLYREEFGQSFAYDDKKNLVSVANLSAQKSGMEYDDADNLKSYRQPGAASTVKYTMDYGSTAAERKRHLLRASATPMGQRDAYTYDAYGNCLTATRQKSGDSAFIRTATAYDANGNYVAFTQDAHDNIVAQSVNSTDGTLTSVTDPAGQKVNYTYDASKRVTSVQTIAGGKTYKNAYTYENDRIKTVSHNTTSDTANDVTYSFDYDALGRKTTVKVGSQTLSTNVYSDDRSGLLREVQYGNGGKVKYAYDGFDRLIGVSYDGASAPRYTYEYDASGRTSVVKDHALNRVFQTEHDLSNRPMSTQLRNEDGSLIYRTMLNYDKQNRLIGFGESAGSGTYKTSYTYDNDNRVTEIAFGGSDKVKYTYDNLGRIVSRTAECGADAGKVASTYTYVAGGHGTGSTTPLVAKITQPKISFEYAYDNRGNIISEKRNGVETTYTYDALGQLIRVNDPHENATWVYNYDRGGNILGKAKYAYTTGALGTAQQTIPYTYGDSNWKDKLTAYYGKAITYDAIGNPLNDGTWTYTWQAGRQLKQMTKSSTMVQFKYDQNGLRTQKIVTVNGMTTTTNYTLHKKLITHMTCGSNSMHFFYDNEQNPAKLDFNQAMYTYIYNVQGDVVGMLDCNGIVVVEYQYDSWGKLLSISGPMADTLGCQNPFRYRGYVYDEEIGLYYLGLRYYNPDICRFSQADNLACLGINNRNFSNNIYHYCNNNPIDGFDPDGSFDIGTFFKGVGRAVTGAVAVVAGTLVCIAGAPVVTIIVAAATITTGVLTVANGAADIQQSVTGDHFVRDTVFNGRQEAYDLYSSVTDTVAAIGTYHCGVYLRETCVMKGAQPGTESKVRLEPGQTLDRYGSEYGRYLTDPGTPASKLALTPDNTGVLNNYVVMKPLTVKTAVVAACEWGGGGGMQYFSWISVKNLKRLGFIATIMN